MFEIVTEALRSAILVSGLVVVMMMLIESLNVESDGRIFRGLRKSGFAQVVFSALLGSVPGCVGGFAVVSLYTHRMLGFGALVAMMIATAGDESFMMLALFPGKAALLFLILFVLAVVAGLVIDKFWKGARPIPTRLEDTYELHDDCRHDHHDAPSARPGRHFGWKRLVMFLGVAVFVTALVSGFLEEEAPEPDGLGLFDEKWMFWLFGALSLVVLAALILASDHFVEEHLWEHIIRKHLPSIFAWTFGVLVIIGTLFHLVDLESWIKGNTALLILIAIAVGLIPESGPHLVFVTLFAAGVIPFPVLLANSIVQDGHASLPLLADSKTAFVKAKAVKVLLGLAVFVVWGLLL
ncbi:MAG: arsenic efflux protein [Bacteroidales bacterium]|nr:arsenic efflux protein [Bacteroidales bacterium]